MRIMLTGGTGYIGSKLVNYFESLDYVVANVGRTPHCNERVINYKFDDDINLAIEEFLPDVFIYLASVFDNDNLDEIINVNITKPLTVLDALVDKNVRFVYIGSYWELGDLDIKNVPIDLYSASKKSFISFMEYYSKYKNIECAEIILYGTYGSDDKRCKLLDYLIISAINGNKIETSPGDQKLNLVDIDDVVKNISDVSIKYNFEIFRRISICSSNEYSVKELVSMISEMCDINIDSHFGAKPYREVELMNPRYLNDSIIIDCKLPQYIKQELLKVD